MTQDAAVESAPSAWVHMHHPDTGGVSYVTREAFDMVWAGKGWVEASDSEVAAADLTGGAVTDLNSLTVTQLEALAVERGVALPVGAKKPVIVDALEQAALPQS